MPQLVAFSAVTQPTPLASTVSPLRRSPNQPARAAGAPIEICSVLLAPGRRPAHRSAGEDRTVRDTGGGGASAKSMIGALEAAANWTRTAAPRATNGCRTVKANDASVGGTARMPPSRAQGRRDRAIRHREAIGNPPPAINVRDTGCRGNRGQLLPIVIAGHADDPRSETVRTLPPALDSVALFPPAPVGMKPTTTDGLAAGRTSRSARRR